MMGRIADRIAQMRGSSLSAIVAEIERMEAETLDVGEDGFSQLWQSYPHKTAKKAAEKAYRAAIKRKVPHNTIAEGLALYVSRKPSDRPWLHLSTFINGERWNDEEAPVMPAVSNQPPKGGNAFLAAAEFLRNDPGRSGGGFGSHRGDDDGLPLLIEHGRRVG